MSNEEFVWVIIFGRRVVNMVESEVYDVEVVNVLVVSSFVCSTASSSA